MYEELIKIFKESVGDLSEGVDEKKVVLEYLSKLSEKEQKDVIRKARDVCLEKYEKELKKNEEKIIFKKKEEEISEPLKEIFLYDYILGDSSSIEKYIEEMKDKSVIKNTIEELPYKTYMDNLKERKYKFKERLSQVFNGEGPKLVSEKKEAPKEN